jgi:ribonucleoside-diphosphate reductase alpha chain
MELISYHAIMASSELAAERGAYETFKGSKWDRGIFPIDTLDLLEQERGIKINVARTSTLNWEPVRESVKKNGMRNSNCMAIAPTATISNIAGCFPSIEPIYNEVYVKSNMSGEFTVVDRYLVEDLKKEGLWNKHILEEIKASDGTIQNINAIPTRIKERHTNAFEIEPELLIKIAAYRGKWIDQSQSLNIFTNTTSGKRLSEIYLNAWMMGLKTTYYLRTLAASSIEKSTVSINRQTTKAAGTQEAEAVAQIVVESVSGATEDVHQSVEEKKLDASEGFEIKACKIEDPDCEACQ